MKTRNAAIKHARENVGQVYYFGGGYAFNVWDERVEAWGQVGPWLFEDIVKWRANALIEAACTLLGVDPKPYDGGQWTDYVPDTKAPALAQ
jgi:hypothetical protein